MKILVGFPPTLSEKGTPLLSQNRQFQYFTNPTFLFPVVLATGATMLRDKGKFDVIWKDAIAEYMTMQEFDAYLAKEQPDIFLFETKTPVVKKHWEVINHLKHTLPSMRIAICGDHVSAFPRETMINSQVDYVLCGGYYDFMFYDLCCALRDNAPIPEGVWYKTTTKEKTTIIDNGRYNFKARLDDAPIVDRKLTRNDLYQREYNLIGRPLAYIMSGRDCWWGKCTFCFHPDMNIITEEGIIPIKDIQLEDSILTHTGAYTKNNFVFKRPYTGNMISIKPYNLPEDITCTPNHKLFALKKGEEEPRFIEAQALHEGDLLTFPLIQKTIDIQELNTHEILAEHFIEIPTKTKTLHQALVQEIHTLHGQSVSQREIARTLHIDRETVNNYIHNTPQGKITLEEDDAHVRFTYGNTSLPKKIPLSNSLMRLAGYYLAEGSTSFHSERPNSATLQFTFHEKEHNYIHDVKKIIKELFNMDAVLVPNPANHTIQVTTYSNILAHFFKNLFGHGSLNKTIPQHFLTLPLDKQRELIKGLFRGDAHLRGKGRSPEYILNTVSKQLAYKTWMILTRLHIIPSFYIPPKQSRTKAQHDQYVLSICGTYLPSLGFVPEDHHLTHPERAPRKPAFIHNNTLYFPIKTLKTQPYSGDVYNMSVPGDQSYTANLVNVSNCVWDHALYPKGTYRARTPENVMHEVKYLVDECGVKEIFDDAGTITVGPWLKKFCNLLIDSGYNKKVIYSCNMRFGALNAEEYQLMKKAGFRLLKYGLESGMQKTIDKLEKGTDVTRIEESARLAKEAGLTVHLTMMVGYPWETKEDALSTYQLAKRLMLKGYGDVLQSTVVIPYPGTPLWKESLEKGWIRFDDPYDYERYDMREPVFNVPGMTPEEVTGLCNKIYHIFLHPVYVIKHLKKIKTWDDIKYTLKGVKAVIGHLKDFSRLTPQPQH